MLKTNIIKTVSSLFIPHPRTNTGINDSNDTKRLLAPISPSDYNSPSSPFGNVNRQVAIPIPSSNNRVQSGDNSKSGNNTNTNTNGNAILETNSIYLLQLQNELKRFFAVNLVMKVKACREIGHLVYYGEIIHTYLANEPKFIDAIFAILRNASEPYPLRLQTLQTLSILCRCTKNLQDTLCRRGCVKILADLLEDNAEEMRQWAVHALLFLMIKNFEDFPGFLSSPGLQEQLNRVAQDDWTNWTHNDAEEMLKLISLL